MYTFHEGYQKILGTVVEGIPNLTAGLKNEKPIGNIMDLTGKAAIVTGGAMGMGACIVSRLCEAGAKVVIADVATEYAEKVIEFFTSKNYEVKFIKTDVRYTDEIQAAVDFTVKEFGSIDILVNNAAVWAHKTLNEITEESWAEIMDVNIKGTVFFVKAVTAIMAAQGHGGKIVNISSVAGVSADPAPVMIEYVASKSAVIAVTKSLARTLKPLGININCVVPGGMFTPGAINTVATDAVKEIRKSIPKVPTADPDVVARVVYMLTTGISDYMHGTYIIADGGAHLGME